MLSAATVHNNVHFFVTGSVLRPSYLTSYYTTEGQLSHLSMKILQEMHARFFVHSPGNGYICYSHVSNFFLAKVEMHFTQDKNTVI